MARRRWIDPSFWDDLKIGRLRPIERLFFIGCMSNADDEGRLIGNAAYLRATIFKYDDMTIDDTTQIRDNVVNTNENLVLYIIDDEEYLAFRHWSDYQKPNYPKESKLPEPPFAKGDRCRAEVEPKEERVRSDIIGRAGQGRVKVGQGSGNNKGCDVGPNVAVDDVPQSIKSIKNRKKALLEDIGVEGKALRELCADDRITPLDITSCYEKACKSPNVRDPVAVTISNLKELTND